MSFDGFANLREWMWDSGISCRVGGGVWVSGGFDVIFSWCGMNLGAQEAAVSICGRLVGRELLLVPVIRVSG